MNTLLTMITAALTLDNSYDDTPGFVVTRWFRWSGIGKMQTASPLMFGTQVLVKTARKSQRICVFWVVTNSLRFDNPSFQTESQFLPRSGDTFTYCFKGNETLFEVKSVSPENGGVLRIEAEPTRFFI